MKAKKSIKKKAKRPSPKVCPRCKRTMYGDSVKKKVKKEIIEICSRCDLVEKFTNFREQTKNL